MPTTTETIAAFIHSLDYRTIPAEVIERAKRQAADAIGVALAGRTQPVGGLIARFVERTGGTADCVIWGTGLRSSAPQAALANGVFCHATDYDDMWLPGTHPTGVILPAAMATAEMVGASGRDLLAALVAGYEVMGKLHACVSGRRGWHPTPVFGTLGAAAASAKLLGGGQRAIQLALGIAASEASGVGAQSGTMTKPFHSGHAARSGVVAAMLAAEGYSACDSVIDHGFFEPFFGGGGEGTWVATAQLGNPFHLASPGIGLKMYPSGYYLHHTFEAALELVQRYDIRPEMVTAAEVGIPRPGHFDRPVLREGLAGKFSHQCHVALAVLDGKLTIESFSDQRALAPEVAALMQKVRLRVAPSLPANPDLSYWPVTFWLADGRVVTASQPLPRSHWRYPLARGEWVGKYTANARRVLDEARAGQVLGLVDGLEELPDVRALTSLLVCPA